MNEIGKRVTGLQHIGLPTNDMEATLAFYQSLGFTLAHQADNDGERVCFLQLAGVCIEAYENGRAVGRAGAIDHIALDVDDIEAAWEAVRAAGYPTREEAIRTLPFWEGCASSTSRVPTGRRWSLDKFYSENLARPPLEKSGFGLRPGAPCATMALWSEKSRTQQKRR